MAVGSLRSPVGRRMALLIVLSKTIQEDSCTYTQQEGLRLRRFGSYIPHQLLRPIKPWLGPSEYPGGCTGVSPTRRTNASGYWWVCGHSQNGSIQISRFHKAGISGLVDKNAADGGIHFLPTGDLYTGRSFRASSHPLSLPASVVWPSFSSSSLPRLSSHLCPKQTLPQGPHLFTKHSRHFSADSLSSYLLASALYLATGSLQSY